MGDWFGDWIATWFGATESEGGGGGGSGGGGTGGGLSLAKAVAPAPPPVVSQVNTSTDSGGHKLQIIDNHGLLSQNPADWPEDLKRAIAECCCGESSGPPPVDSPCCPTLKLSQTIRGNVRNTITHDTGLSLRYFGQARLTGTMTGGPVIHPDWIPPEAFPYGTLDGFRLFPPAWYSDLIEDFTCSYDVSGSYVFTGLGFPVTINWRAIYTVSVYYYVVFGWDRLEGATNPASKCNATIVQVSYPEGAITRTPNFPFSGVPASQPITWRNNAGLPGEINASLGLNQFVFGLSAVTGGMYGSGYQCPSGLNCSPFILKTPLANTAFDQTNYARSLVTQCINVKAQPPSPFTPYPWIVIDGTASTENPGSCFTPAFDPSTHPLIEVFS